MLWNALHFYKHEKILDLRRYEWCVRGQAST